MRFEDHGELIGTSLCKTLHNISQNPDNPFTALIAQQNLVSVPSFTLESGFTLYNVPVAFKTYGSLSCEGDNAMIICHALTGSSDVSDWWGPLLGGRGKAFDISSFFVICFNSLGSPYGSASPVTHKDGKSDKEPYGPEFPLTTVRDDVRLFKIVLEDLGVRQIATAIGGSMGGMLVLEFAFFGKDYVRTIVPMATSARYSAWGISWNEAQRQSIYSDPKYNEGYYSFDDPPVAGLAAARMSALLTYRSRNSFEARFGRNVPDPSRQKNINSPQLATPHNEHWAIHNDGNKNTRVLRKTTVNGSGKETSGCKDGPVVTDPQFTGTKEFSVPTPTSPPRSAGTPTYFSAQSYLRYQGEKFIKRFDANCYIAITRKLDTHDVSRNRGPMGSPITIQDALRQIEQPTLVLGIESDGLFTFAEQQELAEAIPNATLKTIDSAEGHDAFLLEFEQVNKHVVEFLQKELQHITCRKSGIDQGALQSHINGSTTTSSVFGEAEVGDLTAW